MALGDLQKALAVIFTSNQERDEFFADKCRWVASKKYLNAEDAKYLTSLKKEGVKHYSEGLIWKRLKVAKDMLPLFSERVGSRTLIKVFGEYADNSPLINGSFHKYRSHFIRDVVCFCSYIIQNKSKHLKGKEWLADLAYYESLKLIDEVSLIPLHIIVRKLERGRGRIKPKRITIKRNQRANKSRYSAE